MDDLTASKLQTAYVLIKAGESDQACEILIPLVRANPNLVDGWFLLGHAVSNSQEKVRCFQQVLYLDPANQPKNNSPDYLPHRLLLLPSRQSPSWLKWQKNQFLKNETLRYSGDWQGYSLAYPALVFYGASTIRFLPAQRQPFRVVQHPFFQRLL
jgi:hypothetical protein